MISKFELVLFDVRLEKFVRILLECQFKKLINLKINIASVLLKTLITVLMMSFINLTGICPKIWVKVESELCFLTTLTPDKLIQTGIGHFNIFVGANARIFEGFSPAIQSAGGFSIA